MFVIQTVLKNTMSKLSKTVSTVEKYQKLMILTQVEKNSYLDSADSLRPFGKDFSWILTVSSSLSTNSRRMYVSFKIKRLSRRVVMLLPPIDYPGLEQQLLHA